jgi:hypothetical protein
MSVMPGMKPGLSVQCPKCLAKIGAWCTMYGKPIETHFERKMVEISENMSKLACTHGNVGECLECECE